MEIEQEGCDISGIPPDTDYSLHVHVAERYGETVCRGPKRTDGGHN